MASFNQARVLLLAFGALCSGACAVATPEDGEGQSAANSDIGSARVEPTCPPSHEHFTDLNAVGVSNIGYPVALNDRGTVVGSGLPANTDSGRPTSHAFRWKADTGIVDLGAFAGYASSALDVNEHDEVLGLQYGLRAGWDKPVIWDAENVLHELPTLGSPYTYPRKINNRGQVVGYGRDTNLKLRSFIWDAQTGIVVIDLPESAIPNDINDSGVVVGSWTGPDNHSVAFKWTNEDGPIELELLGGADGEALSINNNGEIVGFVIIEGKHVGVKWTDCGALRLPPSPDGVDTMPRAINDQGFIVGDNSILEWETPRPQPLALEWDPMLRVRVLPLQAPESTAADLNNCGDVTGLRTVPECFSNPYLWQPERPAP